MKRFRAGVLDKVGYLNGIKTGDIKGNAENNIPGGGRIGVDADRVQSKMIQVRRQLVLPPLQPSGIVDIPGTKSLYPEIPIRILGPPSGMVNTSYPGVVNPCSPK